MMDVTTHVHVKMVPLDIMNAYHHVPPTTTWSQAVATWSVLMENVARSQDVPLLMDR